MPTYPARTGRSNGGRVYVRRGVMRRDDSGIDADPRGTVQPAEWLAAIGRRWRGGHMPHLARHLAEIAGQDTGDFELDPATLRRLLNQVHLVRPGLQRLLDMLVEHGFLTPSGPSASEKSLSYRLTLSGGGRA